MAHFIVELGVEELPSRFLAGLEEELQKRFSEALEANMIEYETLQVCSTPRRVVVSVQGINPVQKQLEEVVSGPPTRIAYDAVGNPTKALEGFLKAQNCTLGELFTASTDKGDYLAVKKIRGGNPVSDVFATICPDLLGSLPFPKRMRWGSSPFTFARPLRWIMAMFDMQIVPFTIGDLSSDQLTYGHRVHGKGPFTIDHADTYFDVMKDFAKVVSKSEDRKNIIVTDGNKVVGAVNGTILWQDRLLEEVQGLCEYPQVLLGDIDPSFLELPKEVLLTSMEVHQKSFGVVKANNTDGDLLPHFLTVLNIVSNDVALVKKGWERVLRARLEDARFFWKTDLATDFELWLKKLDTVVFLQPLGSMGDKTRRLAVLCEWLAEKTGKGNPAEAHMAGRLSKADLVSEMVGEFDTLQGFMGSIYAQKKGKPLAVAQALAEQYLPAGPATSVPATELGALLSIADKADTLIGCFGLKMIPTGAADPYALRRCALGIARIITEQNISLDVAALLEKAQSLYENVTWKISASEALEKALGFFDTRVKNFFISQGHETLLVDAILHTQYVHLPEAQMRLKALTAFSKRDTFASIALTFKRAVNITTKFAQEKSAPLTGVYDTSLLVEDAEKALATHLEQMAPKFDAYWQEKDFANLFVLLADLYPTVDIFFEKVMVMAEDEKIKLNRLNILQNMVNSMERLADFSALQM